MRSQTTNDTETAIEEAAEIARARALIRAGVLETVRKGNGLSFAEAGKAAGVSASTILRWERGDRVAHGDAALRIGRLMQRLMQK